MESLEDDDDDDEPVRVIFHSQSASEKALELLQKTQQNDGEIGMKETHDSSESASSDVKQEQLHFDASFTSTFSATLHAIRNERRIAVPVKLLLGSVDGAGFVTCIPMENTEVSIPSIALRDIAGILKGKHETELMDDKLDENVCLSLVASKRTHILNFSFESMNIRNRFAQLLEETQQLPPRMSTSVVHIPSHENISKAIVALRKDAKFDLILFEDGLKITPVVVFFDFPNNPSTEIMVREGSLYWEDAHANIRSKENCILLAHVSEVAIGIDENSPQISALSPAIISRTITISTPFEKLILVAPSTRECEDFLFHLNLLLASIFEASSLTESHAASSFFPDSTLVNSSPFPEDSTLLLSKRIYPPHSHIKEKVAKDKALMALDIQKAVRVTGRRSATMMSEIGPYVQQREFSMTFKEESQSMRVLKHNKTERIPFQFKEYAGTVFRRIRLLLNISDESYYRSIDSGFADFVANSKSGSFFSYTADSLFMIKSEHPQEVHFLLSILPTYYDHLVQYPDTLLTQFLGVYRLRKAGRTTHLIVMRNVFQIENGTVQLRYDIKGSEYGRQATPKEKEQNIPVLKDLDFQQGFTMRGVFYPPATLKLGWRKPLFMKQLHIDVEFLRKHNIIDYSLLVGVSRTSSTITQLLKPFGNYGVKSNEFIIPQTLINDERAKLQEQLKAALHSSSLNSITRHTATSLFHQSDINNVQPLRRTQDRSSDVQLFGVKEGIPAMLEDGKSFNEVYLVGIIDILTVFSARKALEFVGKSILHPNLTVSCVPPDEYAQRFVNAIAKRIEGHDSPVLSPNITQTSTTNSLQPVP